MALQKRVSELPAVSQVAATDLLIVSSNNATKRTTVQQIGAFFAANGVAGPQGPAGAAGAAASVAVGTVTTGSPGSSALVVNAGTSSAAVLNFTIPAGAAGAAGAAGPQGPAGPAGTTTWAGITDKPSTFAPSVHQHVAADITDLPAPYSLPTASASVLGGVKIGSGITITDGVISASGGGSSYTLPTASASVLGGVKIGSGVTITDGVISVSTNYAAASHTHAWSTITSTPTTLSGYGITDAVSSSDSRLTDARTPTAHNQAWSTITSTPTTLAGYGITDAVGSSDARLTDARTPTAHKTSHATGGSDAIAPADIGAAAASHAHAWSDITSGVPSSFAPSAHKSSHATGGSDALTPSDIGASAVGHTHTVAQISDFSTSLASPPAIGGTTPAAGSFTTLSASTALTVPSSASGTPAAGHVYRSADTLRYRDSSNTERLLLNNADNLANLGNTATARTNLGLGTAATAASSDFAAASHTHSQLHDRSHAITSSSDHTATAWRAFYSNGSGVVTELALGAANTVLTSNGASAAPTFSALPAGGTKTIIRFHPADNQPPATNFATLDTRNSFLVLEFDAATQESANFIGVIQEGATLTNGLTARLWWMGDTATSGNVRWGVSFERVGTDNDADSFSSVTEATGAANGTSGIETVTSITATAIDSLVAGDRFRLRVTRIADDATNDTMTGDAQLVAVEVQVA